MPQMAPMMWLILFFYFVLVFLMFISNFYFSYTPCKLETGKYGAPVLNSFSWQW